jgi:ribosomal protein L16 Arg81 hydroxylase
MSYNLPEVLAPLAPEEFFAESWGRSYRLVKGAPGKFAGLLTWAELNRLLCRSALDYPRIRLVKEAQVLAPETFMRYEQSRRNPKVFNPRLNPAAMTEQLRKGATLVLDNLEQLAEPVAELALEFQRTFRARVQVNLYASWHTSNAFDVHWDDHDVIVLQVAGRKWWAVYGATTPHPLQQGSASVKPPAGEPLWEGHLEDGDLLYLPRGCWHMAVPVAEPTLHLSFGVFNSTGVDLLNWLGKQLQASEVFRQDLPRFADRAAREAHAARLRDELLKVLGQEDLLGKFFAHGDALAELHPQLSLPWSVLPDPLPPSDETRLRLTTTRPLNLEDDSNGQSVAFRAGGRRLKFPAALKPVLEGLEGSPAISISELCALAAGQLEREKVRAYLGALLTNGLVALADVGGGVGDG